MDDIEFLLLLLRRRGPGRAWPSWSGCRTRSCSCVGGLAIGLVPGLPDVELDPDVVFLVFLPPLLHAAGWYSSPRELWAEVRPLALLAVGLVLATMVASPSSRTRSCPG